jgi:integrase
MAQSLASFDTNLTPTANNSGRPRRPRACETRGTGRRAKIRNAMSALYNHAIRWQFTDRNPITGPVRGSGVRASAKRMSIPDILTAGEMQQLIAAVELRERVLMFLDMVTGLRRGELAGLKWADIDFFNLQINVTRLLKAQLLQIRKALAARNGCGEKAGSE